MDVREHTTHRVETFGGLMVTGGSAPLTGAATQRKTLLLLAVLAAAGPQGVGRERLLGMFWPDSDTERARNALKQAIHALRRDLRDGESIVGVATLRLNPDSITSDVGEFEEAIARGELERAVALYRGPFLDGLWLDGAPEFERWLERERARFAHLHATALERLAVGAAGAGDRAAAVDWWKRLAASDPLSSRVAVGLMKALVAAGEPEAALQHARVHEQLVRQELETPPDSAVAATVDAVRRGLRSASHPAVDAAPSIDPRPADAAPPPAPASASPPPPAAPSRAPRLTGRRLAGALAVVVALALAAAGAPRLARVVGTPRDSPVAAPRSVAVLPFVDMSADRESAYVGDGLSAELIAALGRIDGLRVAARTSSFALRDARLDVRTIGDTLGVASVVEGSVRRDGGRLRVTAQLVDAATGYRLWSAEYDRASKDLFEVQDEIAGAIAGALRLTLVDRRAAPVAARPANSEAYDLYLRGTYLRNRLTRAEIEKAIAYYDRAIALDSTYALAYAGKASAMGPLVYFRLAPREPGLTQMRAAARRALALDETLGEAHVALGIIHFFYEWDWPAARREFTRATELNPGDQHAFHMLANYLRATGRVEEAIAARRRALELDPLNARTAISLGRDYMAAGQYDQAAESFRRGIDIDPRTPLVLGLGPGLPSGMGEVYERRGQLDAAVAEYVQVAERRGVPPEERRALRAAYAAGGMRAFWRRWLAFEERVADGRPRALRVAAVWARIGDVAQSVPWLERAYAERDPGLVYLGVDPEWEAARRDPRVQAILRRMRLRP